VHRDASAAAAAQLVTPLRCLDLALIVQRLIRSDGRRADGREQRFGAPCARIDNEASKDA
jgi:hypothetical protein